MIFRRSKPEDIPAMLEIVSDAVAYLSQNDVPQWQDGYPNEAVLRSDIEKGISYVIEDGEVQTRRIAVNNDNCENLIDFQEF